MAISIETLALAKKYADFVAAGGEAGAVTITESSSAEYQKIYTIKQGERTIGIINIPRDDDAIPTAEGAHGLRYYNNTLQYHDGNKWVTLSLGNLLV